MPDNWNFDFRRKKDPSKEVNKPKRELTEIDRMMPAFFIGGAILLFIISVFSFLLNSYFVLVLSFAVWVGCLIAYELYRQHRESKDIKDKNKNKSKK